MLLIKDQESYDRNHELINQFSVIYNQAFPDENEREELSSIYKRLEAKTVPYSFIILDIIDEQVLGGIILDVYVASQFLHLIYIVTDPKKRRQGIAKKLLKTYLPEALNQLNLNFETVIFESNNPVKTEIDSFDTTLRLDIFRKLGAKHIPITYIQPPLEGRTQYVDNLFLFSYSKDEYLDADNLVKFIEELYYGLNIYDYKKDKGYITTVNSITLNSSKNKIHLV